MASSSLALSRMLCPLILLVGYAAHLPAQQAARFHPRIAGLTVGVDNLDRARALYGNGGESTIQDIHSLCYYVEQDRGYLSVASFERENRIRSVALSTFANVAPGCQSARIVGKHLTALDNISLGSSTAKVMGLLGSPAGKGKVQMGNHKIFYTDYGVASGQLTCQFEDDKLVLIEAEAAPGQVPSGEQENTVAFAERAAVRAVSFREGDAAGFAARRSEFTDDGWKDFKGHMQGFLDEKGSPMFTSSFVASGPAKVLEEVNGAVRIRIPGTLTQSNRLGRTTYRAALEVTAGDTPVKIQKLEEITCAGGSAACQ